MTTQEFTAGLLVIGNEILSGRTQDANIAWIGMHLAARGIALYEVRVVRDEEDAIVEALNDIRKKYRYIFTTGGIGPTHDDITAACVAKAFGAELEINAEAKARLEDFYKGRETTLNEARLRMARIPVGATLINNPDSAAPGFKIGNVFVLAGVPKIMQAMFAHVDSYLEGGPEMLTCAISGHMREGDFALELEEIQKNFADVEIGSYPHEGVKGPSVSLVLRSMHEDKLKQAADDVMAMLIGLGIDPRGLSIRHPR